MSRSGTCVLTRFTEALGRFFRGTWTKPNFFTQSSPTWLSLPLLWFSVGSCRCMGKHWTQILEPRDFWLAFCCFVWPAWDKRFLQEKHETEATVIVQQHHHHHLLLRLHHHHHHHHHLQHLHHNHRHPYHHDSSQNGLDHGFHQCWAIAAMDALLSERIKPWTSSWLGHGCSLLRTDYTMDVVMDALCPKLNRPWTS